MNKQYYQDYNTDLIIANIWIAVSFAVDGLAGLFLIFMGLVWLIISNNSRRKAFK